jgi:hypothetical protein
MKNILRFLLALLLGVIALSAADTPAAPSAKKKNWTAPAAKIHAQALCDGIMAAHPELLSVTMQGTPPGLDKVYTMFAGSFPERIGNASDPDDIEVITKGITIVDPRWRRKDPVPKVVVLTPLRDATGENIGLIVLAYKNDAAHTRSEREFYRMACDLRDSVQPRIASFAALFAPAGR